MATTQKSAARRDAGAQRHPRGRPRTWLKGGGTAGNELLTNAVGATLIPAALRADYGASAGLSSDVTGRAGRMLALSGALVAGLVLAVLVIPEFGPWVNGPTLFHLAFHHER